MAHRAHTVAALGRCRRSRGRGNIPHEFGLELRQRTHSLCRWRCDGNALSEFNLLKKTKARCGHSALFGLAREETLTAGFNHPRYLTDLKPMPETSGGHHATAPHQPASLQTQTI